MRSKKNSGKDPRFLEFEGLRALLGQSAASDPERLDSVAREEGTLDDWLQALSYSQTDVTNRIRKLTDRLRCRFDIFSFHPTGLVEGDCHAGNNTFEVEIDIDFAAYTIAASCSCYRSSGFDQCEHTNAFGRYLIQQFQDPQSDLAAAVGGLASDARWMLEEFDSFIAQASGPPSAGMPEEAPDNEQRIAWRVTVDPSIELEAIVQRPRKRGGGWTKGQKISLERLKNSLEPAHSPVDAAVVKCIRLEGGHYYYRPQYAIDLVSACEALVGHDLVFLGDRPLTVQSKPFGLRVVESDGEFLVQVDFGATPGTTVNVSIGEQGIVSLEQDEPRLTVMQCTEAERNLSRLLLEERLTFPSTELDSLKTRIAALQKIVPVEVPPSLGGETVDVQAQPVVLLRARSNGQLDVALRVRDTTGRLAEPGGGLVRYAGEQDGRPVQCLRNAASERRHAEEIVDRLNLAREVETGDWMWRVRDFDGILDFLERTERDANSGQFEIVWDESSVRQMSVVGSVSPNNVRVEVTKKRDWFGLDGSFRVGQQEFQLHDILKSISNEPVGRYLEIKPGQWAAMTAEFRKKLEHLREVTHFNRKKLSVDATAADVVRALDDGQIEFKAARSWRDCLKRLDRSRELNPAPPASFNGTLRDYQLEGYLWMRRLAEWGVGGCLADDMGLGKTIQMLAVLIDRSETGPALVIAPTSVGFNWQRETERFAPSLTPTLYRDTTRGEFLQEVGDGDVVICSYGLALRDSDALADVNWGTLVLDEAQFIKNSRSKTALAIRDFQADWKVALTGTPMENHLGELWSLFRAVSPGLFGSWEQFRERFAGPIEKNNDEARRDALARLIQPFILRRTKSEVLKELPERTEINRYVDLPDEDRSRYDEFRLAAVGELTDLEGAPDTQDQRFRILALLTRLRQLACHRALVDEAWTGSSAKLDLLIETIQELKDEGHRALVFSQFTQHLGLIRRACDDVGITYQYLDGQTPAKAREDRVSAFQSGEGDVFLISLKAGGTGLNLTAADYVIHMDPWWNPAVEDQATDRTHRIGQTKPVIVYRIIARGTIEEQILNLHADKRDLVSGILDGTQSAAKLSTEELAALIRNETAGAES